MKLVFDTIEKKSPLLVRPIAAGIAGKVKAVAVTPNLKRHLAFMEAELGRSTWFAGEDFTVADIQMSFPVEASAARAGLGAQYPRLQAYLQRIHARPAYKKALEQGGPFELA
jgi:glutathione S-transferase